MVEILNTRQPIENLMVSLPGYRSRQQSLEFDLETIKLEHDERRNETATWGMADEVEFILDHSKLTITPDGLIYPRDCRLDSDLTYGAVHSSDYLNYIGSPFKTTSSGQPMLVTDMTKQITCLECAVYRLYMGYYPQLTHWSKDPCTKRQVRISSNPYLTNCYRCLHDKGPLIRRQLTTIGQGSHRWVEIRPSWCQI